MSPLEAMAKALADYAGDEYDYEHGQKELYVDMARAALIALRDCGVTEGMYEAWVNMDLACNEPDGRRECANEFRAMLDAALEGKCADT